MLKFEIDPRVGFPDLVQDLHLRLPFAIYAIMDARAGDRGSTVAKFARELIEDALKTLVDEEFFEKQFRPATSSPDEVRLAYFGIYRSMDIDELSSRTRLSTTFLAELSQAGMIQGASNTNGSWSYTFKGVLKWFLSGEPRLLYENNPRRRARGPKRP